MKIKNSNWNSLNCDCKATIRWKWNKQNMWMVDTSFEKLFFFVLTKCNFNLIASLLFLFLKIEMSKNFYWNEKRIFLYSIVLTRTMLLFCVNILIVHAMVDRHIQIPLWRWFFLEAKLNDLKWGSKKWGLKRFYALFWDFIFISSFYCNGDKLTNAFSLSTLNPVFLSNRLYCISKSFCNKRFVFGDGNFFRVIVIFECSRVPAYITRESFETENKSQRWV